MAIAYHHYYMPGIIMMTKMTLMALMTLIAKITMMTIKANNNTRVLSYYGYSTTYHPTLHIS